MCCSLLAASIYGLSRECRENLNIRCMRKWFWIKQAARKPHNSCSPDLYQEIQFWPIYNTFVHFLHPLHLIHLLHPLHLIFSSQVSRWFLWPDTKFSIVCFWCWNICLVSSLFWRSDTFIEEERTLDSMEIAQFWEINIRDNYLYFGWKFGFFDMNFVRYCLTLVPDSLVKRGLPSFLLKN